MTWVYCCQSPCQSEESYVSECHVCQYCNLFMFSSLCIWLYNIKCFFYGHEDVSNFTCLEQLCSHLHILLLFTFPKGIIIKLMCCGVTKRSWYHSILSYFVCSCELCHRLLHAAKLLLMSKFFFKSCHIHYSVLNVLFIFFFSKNYNSVWFKMIVANAFSGG